MAGAAVVFLAGVSGSRKHVGDDAAHNAEIDALIAGAADIRNAAQAALGAPGFGAAAAGEHGGGAAAAAAAAVNVAGGAAAAVGAGL